MCGHFFDHGAGSLIAKALPIAAAFIPGIGPLASAALMAGAGGLSSKLQGGSWGDALKAGALSGLGSAVAPMLGNAFASQFPETAASFGVSGGQQTVLDSLGMGSAPSAATNAATMNAVSNGGAGGLSQGTEDFLGNLGGTEQVSSSLAAADPSLAASTAPTGLAALTAQVPVVGPILDKAATWAGNNPLTAGGIVLGGAQAYSSMRARQEQEKQQKQSQADQAAKNATDSANWRLTLNSPPLQRSINPDLKNMDWSTYGYGPEREMLTNNQLFPGQYNMAAGGRVRAPMTDGEPDMDPLAVLRKKPMVNGMTPTTRDMMKRPTRPIVRPSMMDDEPDMDPVNKAKGGRIRKYALGGSVPLPASGIKLTASPRSSNSAMPFGSLMPKLRAMSMNTRSHKVTGSPHAPATGRKYKSGGPAFPRKNGKVSGPGGGQDDKVRAMLSDGEFVMPADVVAHLGDGSNDAGAGVLDHIIKHVRSQKTGKSKGLPPSIKKSDVMNRIMDNRS